MINIAQMTLPYFFEMFIFYFISSTLASHKIKEHIIKEIFFISVFSIIAVIVENSHFFGFFYSFVNTIVIISCLYTVLNVSLSDTVFMFIISFLYLAAVEILTTPFLTSSMITSPAYLPVFGNGIIMISAFLIYKFCFKYNLYQYIQKNRITKIILVNLFIIFFCMVCYSKINPDSFYDILILIFLLTVFLFILNWDIIKNQKKLILKEKEIALYQTYLPVIDELIDQVRIRQHQFDNHIQAIGMLPVTHKDYASLSDAVTNYSSYISSNFRNSALLKINNKLLAGFLFSKYREAENKKRNLDIVIKNINIQTIIPEYELINIIGILVDNGIEYVSDGECVSLIIDSYSNKCHIKQKNKGPILTDELRLNMFRKGYTTKSINPKSHGIGLYNLKQIVDKYNGIIIVSNEFDNLSSYVVFEIEI